MGEKGQFSDLCPPPEFWGVVVMKILGAIMHVTSVDIIGRWSRDGHEAYIISVVKLFDNFLWIM